MSGNQPPQSQPPEEAQVTSVQLKEAGVLNLDETPPSPALATGSPDNQDISIRAVPVSEIKRSDDFDITSPALTLVSDGETGPSRKPSITSERPPTNRLPKSLSRRSSVSTAFAKPLPWLRRRISPRYGIGILYTLSFLSAALDAASFTAWTAFLNMQTGNTIFLALGASNQPANNPWAWMTALGSIVSFIVGSQLFGGLARFLKRGTRLSLSVSFALQALITIVPAALIQIDYIPVPVGIISPSTVDNGAPEPRELAAIMPLAFAAAGQVCATRELGFPLIPTLVLTTIYADAFRDTKIWKKGRKNSENPMRSKMLITIVTFVAGAIAGGWISRSSAGISAVMWAAVGWRIVVAAMWALWPWDENPDDTWWVDSNSSSAGSNKSMRSEIDIPSPPVPMDLEDNRGQPLRAQPSLTWAADPRTEKAIAE